MQRGKIQTSTREQTQRNKKETACDNFIPPIIIKVYI